MGGLAVSAVGVPRRGIGAALAYAEADGVVFLAREIDRLDVLRHQGAVGLLLIMAVEVLKLDLDLLGPGQVLVGLRRVTGYITIVGGAHGSRAREAGSNARDSPWLAVRRRALG